ncbi:hypothetical protein WDU94_008303 [Cyamophila willieti]|uniref:Enhancer of yellow 2 transcription factor n=1 Tax=Cacopsylla melanoneura TaxID=428564 RepID=A0A8D8QC38_9HEMI
MERDPSMLYVVENMSGNVEVFNELLRKRLAESGWCDQVKLMCIETIKTQLKNGQTPKMEDLIAEVSGKARTMVPTAVKKELLMEMKEHLLQKFGYYDTKMNRD